MEGREALKRLPGRERSKFRLSETLSNSACLGESTALVAAGTPTVPRLDLWWVSGQLEGMGGAQAEVTISDGTVRAQAWSADSHTLSHSLIPYQ